MTIRDRYLAEYRDCQLQASAYNLRAWEHEQYGRTALAEADRAEARARVQVSKLWLEAADAEVCEDGGSAKVRWTR